MFISRTAEAWIAIRPAFPDELDWAVENNARVASSLREFPVALAMVHATLNDVDISEGVPSLDILSQLKALLGGLDISQFSLRRVRCLVKFETGKSTSPAGLLDSFAANQLKEAIDVVSVLNQIARPGSLGVAGGVVIVDNKILSTITRQWFMYELHSGDSRRIVWPQIVDLSLAQVCSWSGELGALSSAIARTRVQRSFAALTYALSLPSVQAGETLFRAMQGLEAFFSDGVGDLRRQLSEKSQLWLGTSGKSKNIVGHLYDLRSSYVHGSANLSYSFGLHDSWEEDRQTSKKLSEGVEFAVRLLLATIQRCIRDQVFELQWKYGYEAQPVVVNPSRTLE